MAVRDRIRRYRTNGAAADLVRVEVLVPPGGRDVVLKAAAELRESHRKRLNDLEAAIATAAALYGVRAANAIDPARPSSPAQRARVVASGLMKLGDARAFVIARWLLDLAGDLHAAQ
jgi:hypothetical protein